MIADHAGVGQRVERGQLLAHVVAHDVGLVLTGMLAHEAVVGALVPLPVALVPLVWWIGWGEVLE